MFRMWRMVQSEEEADLAIQQGYDLAFFNRPEGSTIVDLVCNKESVNYLKRALAMTGLIEVGKTSGGNSRFQGPSFLTAQVMQEIELRSRETS